MPAVASERLLTTEDLLAYPDDGMERWLVRGHLREKYPEFIEGAPMTVRNRLHSEVLITVGTELKNWLRSQPGPRGKILGGEAGVRLAEQPETTVGIDVVYISAETAAKQTDKTKLINGVPILAVEILSPSDEVEDIREKIDLYLDNGVPLIWVIDPYDRVVRVYRPNAQPVAFNADQQLTAEPHLPGFNVSVADLFD
jgi:Uma2 family endonuclease